MVIHVFIELDVKHSHRLLYVECIELVQPACACARARVCMRGRGCERQERSRICGTLDRRGIVYILLVCASIVSSVKIQFQEI